MAYATKKAAILNDEKYFLNARTKKKKIQEK